MKHFESYLAEYDDDTPSDNTMSLISLNNEHLSNSLNNTNNKTSDFSITESSIPKVTVSYSELSHDVNNSISPVIAQRLLNSTPKTNLTSTPEPKIQYKNTEEIIYMQPIENTYGKTSQYLIKIFGEKNFIAKFDRLRKYLKAPKTRENLGNYRSIIAEIEVKLSCNEDTLKGILRELEMKFHQESDSNSIYPNADSVLADKDEYNNIIDKLKYLKIVKKELFHLLL